MNHQDISELQEAIKLQIGEIKVKSASGSVNKVLVKNTLENLRSILDYLAIDIREKLNQATELNSRRRVYFPNCEKEVDFKKAMRDNFKGLDNHLPRLFRIIFDVQPFACGDSWLKDLCDLTNEVKHRNLIETERSQYVQINQANAIFVKAKRGSDVSIKGNIVNGVLQDSVTLDRSGGMTLVPKGGNTKIDYISELVVKGRKLELSPFLEKCEINLKTLCDKIGNV